MKQKILRVAKKNLSKLIRRYSKFISVGVDDWRGYRFIYDSSDFRTCDNCCDTCLLYTLLKNEKEQFFSATLYPASEEDKKLYGPQKYLNCKSLEQYKQCYITFILQKANTEKDLRTELSLVKNFRILYSSNTEKNLLILEREFRNDIITSVLRKTNRKKRQLIRSIIRSWPKSKTGIVSLSCLN